MGEILKTKADTLAIHLILSSFNTPYNEVVLGERSEIAANASDSEVAAAVVRVFISGGTGRTARSVGCGVAGPRAGQIMGVSPDLRFGDRERADVGGRRVLFE